MEELLEWKTFIINTYLSRLFDNYLSRFLSQLYNINGRAFRM